MLMGIVVLDVCEVGRVADNTRNENLPISLAPLPVPPPWRCPDCYDVPQTLYAVSTTSSSLRHCSSSVSKLPAAVDAKPH